MFAGIRDDFDSQYWTRGAVAVLLASGGAAALGAAWLLVELLSRIAWFLAAWLAQWLFPPILMPLFVSPPPLTVELTQRVMQRDRMAAVEVVEVDLGDMGDFDPNPVPDLDLAAIRPPPDPALREAELRISEMTGLLAILGSSNDNSIANIFGSSGLDTLDGDLGGLSGIGGLIGATGDAWGAGGLGSRGSGLGGGGTAEGLGGLGTIGTIGHGGGTGQGYGSGSGRLGTTTGRPTQIARVTPKLGPSERAYIEANGSVVCRVSVTVGESGAAEKVRVQTCPAELKAAVVDAANRTGFTAGKPGTATLTYRFE